MKTMTLTGLGTEQDFSNGGTSFFLVFNGGDLRIPISETAAELVIKEMYGSQEQDHSPVENHPIADQSQHPYDEDDDVDQI